MPAILLLLLSASDLDQIQSYTAARASSAAVDGSNNDRALVQPQATHLVADIRGPGRLVHLWFTIGTAAPDYLARTRLKIYWDGEKSPSVDVPFGLFHALDHGVVRPVRNAFLSVEARPELNHNLQNPNVAGFNSYFPMPYGTGARIVLENGTSELLRVYHQIDYQIWKSPPSPLRFHAAYRESPPEPAASCAFDRKNPDGRANHPIADAQGAGHLVGVVLSVDAAGAGWWEGDEMIWIDGAGAPAIRGTGTEDYFGGAWGFRQEYHMPHHGVSVLIRTPERKDWQAGRFTTYRLHEKDPIPFQKSLKMSIERGHDNCRRDSTYRSVAYWYQRP